MDGGAAEKDTPSRQAGAGLFPESTQLPERNRLHPEWSSVESRVVGHQGRRPEGQREDRSGSRGDRKTNRPGALVWIERHIAGTTWAVRADRPNLFNVLARGDRPAEGKAYQANETKAGWTLGPQVDVQEVPAEVAHPDHPELVAHAAELSGPGVLRVGTRVLMRSDVAVIDHVRRWTFRTPAAEAAYFASVIGGTPPYGHLELLFREQTRDAVELISHQAAATLGQATAEFKEERQAWGSLVETVSKAFDDEMNKVLVQIQGKESEKLQLDGDVNALLLQEAELGPKVTALKVEHALLYAQVKRSRQRIQDQEQAEADPRAALRLRRRVTDEVDALKSAAALLGSRFDTPLPLVLLHIALKHAPFTVLTGPSGAGKTSLVHQYARALGINVTTIAVQPNWTSVQDLHGYTDPIAGTRYRGTPFSMALQAQVGYEAADDQEGPLDLVLLDEINLSFVEYFLADYLSAFETETRTVRLATRDETEKLLPEPFAWLRRTHGQVQVPRSFLIVGTANEDHTTRAFSDKFRDRSAFLRVPAPRIEQALDHPEAPVVSDVYVPRSAWETWQTAATATDPQRQAIRTLAQQVADLGLPLSVRVFQRALRQYADAERLLERLDIAEAAKVAYDLALALSVAPKYGQLLVGRDQEERRQTLRAALVGSGGAHLTSQVLEGIWPKPRS